MDGQTQFVSLRLKLTLIVGFFLALMAIILGYIGHSRMDDLALESAYESSDRIVGVLAKGISATDDPSAIDDLLQEFPKVVPNAVYAVVKDGSGRVLGSWPASHVHVDQQRLRRVDDLDDLSQLDLSMSVGTPDGGEGTLSVGLAVDELAERVSRRQVAGVLVSILLIIIGIAGALVIGGVLVRPINVLNELAGEIVATGDLSAEIDVESDDEVGLLADNFRALVARLRTVLMAMNRSTQGLEAVTAKLSEAGMTASSGAVTIQSLVRDTASSMEEMLSSLRGVGINVD